MSVNRFSANFKTRDDVFDSITPENFRQKEISAPYGPWRPAAWLPIAWTASNIHRGQDAFVVSKGKVLAQDRQGNMVPAGYRWFGKFAALADVFVTYTADDVSWLVTDIITGEPVAAAGTRAVEDVAAALMERGLVLTSEVVAEAAARPVELAGFDATKLPTDGAGGAMTAIEVKAIMLCFISEPVGIAAFDFHTWGGLPEEGDQRFTNYQVQHQVQFLTEMQMMIPHRAGDSTAADAFTPGTEVTAVSGAGDFVAPGEVWTAAALADATRYSLMGVSAASDLVALGLTGDRPAANTNATPISADVAGVLVSEKSSLAGVAAEGDWYLDADAGVILLHADTWATLTGGATTVTLSYHYYEMPGADDDVASAHKYVHFEGYVRPGDKLGVDKQSNFVRAGEASDVLEDGNSIGLVHYV